MKPEYATLGETMNIPVIDVERIRQGASGHVPGPFCRMNRLLLCARQ